LRGSSSAGGPPPWGGGSWWGKEAPGIRNTPGQRGGGGVAPN